MDRTNHNGNTPVASLKKLSLFSGLDESELSRVSERVLEKKVPRGQLVFQESERCERIFWVISGKVKVYRSSNGQREQILELLGPGDSCACHPGAANWCCGASAEAVRDSVVLTLPRTDYARLVQTNGKLTMALSQIFAERLRQFSALVDDVSLKDVRRRLARLLLTLAEEKGIPIPRGLLIPTDFTREDMAARIGTTRETVVRYLYELKKNRVIDLKSRRFIVLTDKAALEKLL